jgi:Glycosyl transferase 4-like domain
MTLPPQIGNLPERDSAQSAGAGPLASPLKRVLIVSPHFPPINAPDMQRVRMSLPYYQKMGWEPVVLAVNPACQSGMLEAELLPTLPEKVRIVRTAALPYRLCRYIGLGNLGLRALLFFLWTGSRILSSEKFDLVFFSNTQFVTLLLGRFWLRCFGVPYVIDVQDPWRTDFYERRGARPPPGGWKYAFARLQAWAWEGWCFRRAAAVMSVSPSYLTDLRARYRAFATVPTAVIGFGASAHDQTQARALASSDKRFPRTQNEIHFVYTGASGPILPDSLLVLFQGLRTYRLHWPERAARLRFHFIGTSYAPPGQGRLSVWPIAKACGVDDLVVEITQRIGHLESIHWQNEADGLLILGSTDLAYSPSKIYPYYLSGRPILGLVFKGSVLERLLEELQCAYLVGFHLHESKDAAHAQLHTFFDLALAGFPAGSLPVRQTDYFNQHFLAEELTRQQVALFNRAVAPAPVSAA